MKNFSKLGSGQILKQLLKDPDRKPLLKIALELVYLSFVFRTLPKYYFSRFLFKKDRTNIRDYYPGKLLYGIKPHFNENGATDVLENKLYFDFFYRPFNINLPKILMYNHRDVFVVNNMTHHIHTPSEFRALLQEVFNANKMNDSIFIKRTYGTYGGAKIYKLLSGQLGSDSPWINDLFQEVIQSGYLFQETVKQHAEMNRLNSSCLNTLRLATFINPDGQIEMINGYLRTSVTNNYVDNITAGGCAISIDLTTGRLDEFGYMSLKDGGIRMPTEHPFTHTIFSEYTIPYFEQAKQMVIEVAGYQPGLRLIGWDVAIGESGPVLIEGNSDFDVAGMDKMMKGVRSNPVFRKVLKEVNL